MRYVLLTLENLEFTAYASIHFYGCSLECTLLYGQRILQETKTLVFLTTTKEKLSQLVFGCFDQIKSVERKFC